LVTPFLKKLLAWIRLRKGLPIQSVEMENVDAETLQKELEQEEAEEVAQIEEEAAKIVATDATPEDRSLLLRRMLGIQNVPATPISEVSDTVSGPVEDDAKTQGQRLLNLLLDAKEDTMQRPVASFASAPSVPDFIPKHKSILLKHRSAAKDVNKEKQASLLALLKGDAVAASLPATPLAQTISTLLPISRPAPPPITTSKPEPIPTRTQGTEISGSLESDLGSLATTPGGTPPWLPPRPHAPAPPFTPTTPVFGLLPAGSSPSKRSVSPQLSIGTRSRSGSNVLGTTVRVYGEKRGKESRDEEEDGFKFKMDEIMGAF